MEYYNQKKKEGGNGMLQQRSVATVIILSIITCGIYSLYWSYVTINALDEEGGASNMSPVLQFVLMFFYVGMVLFGINANANINAIRERRGLPTRDNQVAWLLLGLFIPIVLVGIVQNEINQLADA